MRWAYLGGAILGGALRRRELATALAAALAQVAVLSFTGAHWVSLGRDGGVESLVLVLVGGMRRGTRGDLLRRWRRLAGARGDEVLS